MSGRDSASGTYALKLWKPGAATMQAVLARSGENLVGGDGCAQPPEAASFGKQEWSESGAAARRAVLR